MCYGLAEASGHIVQDNVDKMMVYRTCVDMKYIHIVQVFLHNICLFELADLVEIPVWLLVITIVLPNLVLNLFLSSIPVPVCFPPF